MSRTAVLVPMLVVLAQTARTSELMPVSPAENTPPHARLAFVPIVSRVPEGRLSFEDYTSTNNLGDGGQFYSPGPPLRSRSPRTPTRTSPRDGRHVADKRQAGATPGERGTRPRKTPAESQLLRFPARSKRSPAVASSPSLVAVDDPSPHWAILSHAEKPQFVTSKGGRTAAATAPILRTSADAKASASDATNPRANEIPGRERPDDVFQLQGEPVYDTNRDYLYRDAPPVNDFAVPPPRKRIIYYANLPEVVRHGPDYIPRGYDGYQGLQPPRVDVAKYPRESRFDYGPAPVAISSGDRFTYVPGGRNSYTIVDAAPPSYYDASRYNRIPAPYQPQANRLYYSRPGYEDDGRYLGRGREAVRPPPPTAGYSGTLSGDGPYRDYNPRQPAPWSMQVGTRLMVNDDGRPMAPRPGQPGRPFYVESQRSNYPSRYARADDMLLT